MKKILILLLLLCNMNILYAAAEKKEEAQLIYYEGKAEAKRAQKEEWENVKLKMMLYPKDRVRTRLQSRVELKLPDDSIFNIGENTTFDIQKLFTDSKSNTKKFSFKLFAGDLVGKIEKLKKGDTFEIETPVALVGFRGTTVFIHVEPNGETWIGLKSGLGYIRSIKTGGEKVIEENNYFLIGIDGAFIGSGILSGSDFERFENLEKVKGELIKKGEINAPKIISVEKNKGLASIKGQADPGNTINLVSSIGQSLTAKSDESGNFNFTVNIGEDTSPPLIKVTTSEFGKKATNNRNLKIAGLVTDRAAGGNVNFSLTAVNKNGEKSVQTIYKMDALNEGLKFFVNGREIRLIAGIINTSYMLNEGKNVLELRALDGAGNESKEAKVVYLDTRPPAFPRVNVSPGVAAIEDSIEITVETEDDSELKNTARLILKLNDNSFNKTIYYNYTSKQYSIKIKPIDLYARRSEGNWSISVELEDSLGNKAVYNNLRSFEVRDLPPPPPDRSNKKAR